MVCFFSAPLPAEVAQTSGTGVPQEVHQAWLLAGLPACLTELGIPEEQPETAERKKNIWDA